LLGKGKIDGFYLDVGRITGNFHFSIAAMGTMGLIYQLGNGKFLFLVGGLDS